MRLMATSRTGGAEGRGVTERGEGGGRELAVGHTLFIPSLGFVFCHVDGIWFKDVSAANLICGGFYTSCDALCSGMRQGTRHAAWCCTLHPPAHTATPCTDVSRVRYVGSVPAEASVLACMLKFCESALFILY